jgi:hypothetical protein
MNSTQQINILPEHIKGRSNAIRLKTAPIFDFLVLFSANHLSLPKNRFETLLRFSKCKPYLPYYSMAKIITLVIGKVWICATNPEFALQIRLALRDENCSKVAVFLQ